MMSKYKREISTGKYQEQAVTVLLLVLFAAASVCYFLHPSFYTDSQTGALNKKLFAAELLLIAAAAAATALRRKCPEKLGRAARPLLFALFLFTPLLTFAVTQVMADHIPAYFNLAQYGGLKPGTVRLNLLIIAMLLLLLLVLTNNLKAAGSICLFFGIFFCIANYYVTAFRNSPILAGDFASLSTAMSVAGNFSYEPDAFCLLGLQCGLLYLMALRCLGSGRLFGWKWRLIFSAASFAVLAVFADGFLFSDYLERHKVHINQLRPLVSYRRNGTFLTLVRSLQYLQVDRPPGYSAQLMKSLADTYPSDAAADAEELPNLIVIIDEAFSDLGAVGELDASEDCMPFLHSLSGKTVCGCSYASQLGGGTANTEFEVLTGNSTLLLPPNCVAFQLYIKKQMPSLARIAEELGYQGLFAMHPYQKLNYNRSHVYPLLGFRTFLSMEDFDADAPKLRSYLSDLAVDEMIIRRYEEAKAQSDQPFFFYTMTMQNHSGYDGTYENFQTRITLPTHPCAEAEQYLSLVRYSDEALQKLTQYFAGQPEPTAILFLGDHQPDLPAQFLRQITGGACDDWSGKELMKRYAIPFVLWTNFNLPPAQYEKTSMNYLQSILFDALGLPMTGYQKYLLELQKEIPAVTSKGYWGADGTFYDIDDSDSPYRDKLTEYESILYNNIFDPDRRPDAFYNLK